MLRFNEGRREHFPSSGIEARMGNMLRLLDLNNWNPIQAL